MKMKQTYVSFFFFLNKKWVAIVWRNMQNISTLLWIMFWCYFRLYCAAKKMHISSQRNWWVLNSVANAREQLHFCVVRNQSVGCDSSELRFTQTNHPAAHHREQQSSDRSAIRSAAWKIILFVRFQNDPDKSCGSPLLSSSFSSRRSHHDLHLLSFDCETNPSELIVRQPLEMFPSGLKSTINTKIWQKSK